jgi:hypothetical protein
MASLKCLACGHDNKVGDESCASCSSSLNLRLCSGCEAINATNAERCHSCGALFGAAAEPPPALEEVTEERADATRIEKPLPAAWIAGAARASRGDRRLRAALWVVPVLALGSAAYYFYGAPQAAPAKRPVVEVKRAAPLAQEPVVQQVKQVAVEVRPAVAQAKAPHLAESKPAIEAKTSPVVERRGRITHTKAEPSEVAAAPAAKPAAPAATGTTAETAACPPGVVALGLCKGN